MRHSRSSTAPVGGAGPAWSSQFARKPDGDRLRGVGAGPLLRWPVPARHRHAGAAATSSDGSRCRGPTPLRSCRDYVDIAPRDIRRVRRRGRVWITAAATTRSPACSRTSIPGPSTWLPRPSGPAASTAGCAPLAGRRRRRLRRASATSSHPAVLRRVRPACARRRAAKARRAPTAARAWSSCRGVICRTATMAAVAAARDELRSRTRLPVLDPARITAPRAVRIAPRSEPDSAAHARRKEWSAPAGVTHR